MLKQELEQRLGCNRTYYYHLENGVNDLSINMLRRLQKNISGFGYEYFL